MRGDGVRSKSERLDLDMNMDIHSHRRKVEDTGTNEEKLVVCVGF